MAAHRILPFFMTLCYIAGVSNCGETKFKSGKISPLKSDASKGTSDTTATKDSGAYKNVAGSEDVSCADTYRPSRLAFVVDNTGSNSCTPGKIQDTVAGVRCDSRDGTQGTQPLIYNTYAGTDPIKPKSPYFRSDEGYTERQLAVYETIVQIVQRDEAAIQKNPSFLGTDTGILSFPLSNLGDEAQMYKIHTGSIPTFPTPMYNLKKTKADESFKEALWELLRFTHRPSGLTPYKTAFEGAKKLLVDNKAAGDERPGLVVFITDGLPTDLVPSEIVKARKALGPNNKVSIFSIYRPNTNVEQQNKPAKDSLLSDWNDRNRRSPEFSDFESYWKRLTEIPKDKSVADEFFDVSDPSSLKFAIRGLLTNFTSCK